MEQNFQPPMKWHNFLVKIGLPLGVVGNIVLAVTYFTGIIYETSNLNPATVYRVFPSLQVLDIIYGVCLLLCAAYTWQTCKSLNHFRAAAPTMVLVLYGLNFCSSLLYNTAALMIMNADLASLADQATAVVGAILGIVLHRIYYMKRAHLFTN